MKIRFFYVYRVPRKEMRSLQLISTFIKIRFYLFSVQRGYLMFEEYRIRNYQSNLPVGVCHPFFKRLISQARPAFHQSRHIFGGMFPSLACGSGPNQNSAYTVALDIRIYSIAGRNRKEFHTRIRPYRSVRSEEHTSELQSRQYLVCRLL